MNVGEVFTAKKKREERGNAFKVTIVDSSVTYSPSLLHKRGALRDDPKNGCVANYYSPSLWFLFGHYMQLFLFLKKANQMKCVYNYCVQRSDSYPGQPATNRYQFIYRLLLKIEANR